MKSMFRFVNRETTIGCKRVIFNGLLTSLIFLKQQDKPKTLPIPVEAYYKTAWRYNTKP